MTLNDIILLAGDLGIHERRSLSEEYCELVFFARDVEGWHKILTQALGPARKPAGKEPTQQDLDLTQQTGGIRLNQILYERSFEGKTMIAKIWPWNDAQYMTLKMAVLFH